jgi:hypothetical protein
MCFPFGIGKTWGTAVMPSLLATFQAHQWKLTRVFGDKSCAQFAQLVRVDRNWYYMTKMVDEVYSK